MWLPALCSLIPISVGERVSIFHIITRAAEAVISPSGCIRLGGAGVVDLDIFVGAGAGVSKQVRADRNCARVVAVTSEIKIKLQINLGGKENVTL